MGCSSRISDRHAWPYSLLYPGTISSPSEVFRPHPRPDGRGFIRDADQSVVLSRSATRFFTCASKSLVHIFYSIFQSPRACVGTSGDDGISGAESAYSCPSKTTSLRTSPTSHGFYIAFRLLALSISNGFRRRCSSAWVVGTLGSSSTNLQVLGKNPEQADPGLLREFTMNLAGCKYHMFVDTPGFDADILQITTDWSDKR
ncbi:hypothetical protein EDD16DRAFT_217889 [Pisolithus croceorrhizus]|nr:hypothetical protein EDD16DRAFT_217889 [Pisolithus croceorrhizus]